MKAITSREEAGTPVADMFPDFARPLDLDFTDAVRRRAQSVRLRLFRDTQRRGDEQARALFDAGVRIVDFSADFRIKDTPSGRSGTRSSTRVPSSSREAVYGLPEINREEIQRARIVANPGCYPTAVQLGFLPLVKSGCVDLEHLIADAKSGVSGAGRKAEVDTLFAEAADNFKAYARARASSPSRDLAGLASSMAGRAIAPDVRAASDAAGPRHPRHAVRAAHARCRAPGNCSSSSMQTSRLST